MNSRDMFKGKSPNTRLDDREVYDEEAAFRKVAAAGGAAGTDSPRLNIVLRPKRQTAAADGSGLGTREHVGLQPGSEAASAPVTVLDAGAPNPPDAAPGGFARLVAPLSPSEFIDTHYAEKRPVLFRGEDGRFASLIGWDDVNALVSIDLLQPRMRLVRDGNPVPLFYCHAPRFGHGWRGHRPGEIQTLDDRRLMTLLRQGTTLILNGIHEYHPPIGALADVLETALGVYAQINLYASWQATRGFATHWDAHDVFIVQVTGCKRWDLFGETRRFPMKRDAVPNTDAPIKAVWSEILRPGDVLYIPRGWWHDARTESLAAEEGMGSLHLTCSLLPITGLDLLEWLKGELAHHEVFRRELPLHPRAEASGAHFAELRDLIVAALDGDVAGQLRDHFHATWSERRRGTIGSYIEPWKSPDWSRCELRLRGARYAVIEHREAEGTIGLKADGYTWSFDPACMDMLAPLVEAGRVTVNELKTIASDRFPADFVDGFARLLVEESIVYAVFPDR